MIYSLLSVNSAIEAALLGVIARYLTVALIIYFVYRTYKINKKH